MKHLIVLISLVFPLVACLEESDDSDWELTENNPTQPNNNQNNVTPPDPKVSPVLSAEFVSGHLGNYMDCPEQGYSGGDQAGRAPGLWEGDCAEDGCGILNCEGAQVTFSLDNAGRVEARNLRITGIELFNADGAKVADLPAESVTHVETGEPMLELAGDSQGMFYLFFKGPAQPYDLLQAQDGQLGRAGVLIIKLKADNHAEITIETPYIYVLDAIAT